MYKMSSLLKYIIAILIIALVAIVRNRIILWLLLFVLTLYNFRKGKYVLLAFDLVLVLLLGLSNEFELALFLFKIGYIYVFLVTVYYSLSKEDLLSLNSKKSLKNDFYEDNFERIVENIKSKKNKYYEEDTSIDDKIERDLERQYLQSRIRYNGFYESNEKAFSWNSIDTIILIACIILFIIMFIFR